jgi:FkbM family methyltransferase
MNTDALKYAVRATVPRPLRNWLRSPSHSAEWLWDAVRFSLGSVESFEIVPNLRLAFHPHAYKLFLQSQVDDPEQRDEFRSFISHCRRGMLLFDIGAHYGVFSLVAAQLGGAAVAVDPSPAAAKMISVQASLNHLLDRIRILQSAVSDSDCTLAMLDAGVLSAGYFKLTKEGRPSQELTSAHATTVDLLVRQFGPPTHIKIDVEGHEAAVLRGARTALQTFAPILFVELHTEMVRSDGGDPCAALDELHRLGYSTHAFSGEPIATDAILNRPIIRIVARPAHRP